MATAALAREVYKPDTKIEDVEEPPFRPIAMPVLEPIARPRVATKELTMQVLVDGKYHRRTPDLATTSCGRHTLHSEFTVTRREELRHPLSRDCGCFTPFELAKADEREERGT